MSKPRCPHCNRTNTVPTVCFRNVDAYGNNSFHVPCTKCKEMIHVILHREVKVVSIASSYKTKSLSDFPPSATEE